MPRSSVVGNGEAHFEVVSRCTRRARLPATLRNLASPTLVAFRRPHTTKPGIADAIRCVGGHEAVGASWGRSVVGHAARSAASRLRSHEWRRRREAVARDAGRGPLYRYKFSITVYTLAKGFRPSPILTGEPVQARADERALTTA